ncbi:unnamed protein product [Protopolystoma xenopodis]|uniref:FHA domain-containing protein n=1 Tax=Protopolystoma xenopodis TaxID=117903 RepID=A0A448X4V0_9PLAT|nr:unnamed protein product [Protopolystoma xenopodis]
MSANFSAQHSSNPLLILTCQQGSHPFQERRVVVNQIIKVGRAVARVKPSPNNAIFDCKVLSRSHALIWFENGQVTLFANPSLSFGFEIQTVAMEHSSITQGLLKDPKMSLLTEKSFPGI